MARVTRKRSVPVETPAPVPEPAPAPAPLTAGPLTAPATAALPTDGYLVTEADPMKGISPLPPVYFNDKQEAIDYGITRIPFFGKVEVCMVLYRALTTLVPQTQIESADEAPAV